MGKYFGTDGFRGEAGIGLTADHAYQVGRYLGYYYTNHGEHRCRICIGKDTRLSCYTLEYALIAGLTSCGADVYILHVITTPGVSYITRTGGFDCGIMITASHNPYQDNGIKLVNRNGEKMDDDVIDSIEAYLDGTPEVIPFATGDHLGRVFDYTEAQDMYAGHVISAAGGSLAGYNIGLDCSNGATWKLAEKVFKALGANVTVIHNEPNGTNVNVACGSTHIESLQQLVRDRHLDVGFAFDGDADRCLAVDEKGNVVNGDMVIYICAKWMKAHGRLKSNRVVTTVMSNFGLYKALDKVGIGYEKTKVGDKYVYENMKSFGHEIGGEQNGHTIFTEYATTGDGMVTAVRLMTALQDSHQTLSELNSDWTMYPQVLKNVEVTDKEKTLCDSDVLKTEDQVSQKLGDEGRILVRASGTEPVLRVMAEAPTQEQCEWAVDTILASMKAKGYVTKVR